MERGFVAPAEVGPAHEARVGPAERVEVGPADGVKVVSGLAAAEEIGYRPPERVDNGAGPPEAVEIEIGSAELNCVEPELVELGPIDLGPAGAEKVATGPVQPLGFDCELAQLECGTRRAAALELGTEIAAVLEVGADVLQQVDIGVGLRVPVEPVTGAAEVARVWGELSRSVDHGIAPPQTW